MENDYEAFVANIATNVRKYAKRRKLSLNRLVEFAGVSRAHFYKFLNGEEDVGLQFLHKLAVALEVDFAKLVERQPPAKSGKTAR